MAFCLLAALAWAQTQPAQSKTDQTQDIPDAPSTTRPPQPQFPTTPPATAPQNPPFPGDNPPSSGNSNPPGTQETPPEPAPLPKITTVPEGGATDERSPDDLYKIKVPVNAVLVPVRVTDESGHLVNGLLSTDFSVYEDGKKQALNYFTSDPFALSAAVVFDLGMPDAAVQRVNQTFPALEGAFSQYDEVAIYTYSNTVGRMADFAGVGKKLTSVLDQLKTIPGENNGPPIVDGPLGPQGPIINGMPVDPSVPIVRTPPQESHVLNDAILAAALDLRKRNISRRKVIFVISDGREIGSNASYKDVLKVLLSNNIAVYGVGVGGASIPGYGKLQRLHLPRMGYGDILPKYSNATAGEFFTEVSREAIETAYSHTIGDARNQYTLGYATRTTPSEAYRQVEIRVDRPGCKSSLLRPCVDVFARDGYYPLPAGR